MFCPALGIDEDPVSGNAHALLGAYLLHHDLIAPAAVGGAAHSDTVEFTGAQGHYLGRPGRVSVALQLEQRVLRSVSVIGEAVVVFATTLDF
jgi:PhzF family phenazine biosynthesis protein